MNKKLAIVMTLAIVALAGWLAAFQIATENTGGGRWTHLDLQAVGTCLPGPSNVVRLCGSANSLMESANGGATFMPYPQLATGTLTNAQILALNATPIQVLAAQGSGTLIQVVGAVLENLNTGVAYANGGTIGFDIANSSTLTVASATAAATFLTSPTATETIAIGPGQAAGLGSDTVNKPLVITNNSAPFITGTGTLKYWLYYNVVSGL